MNELTENERRMLELIVEFSAGDTQKVLNRKATIAALGLTPSEGENILKSLTSKRLIRYIIFGSLCITEAGILWGRRQANKPQAYPADPDLSMNELTENERKMLELIVEFSAGDTEKVLNRKAIIAALGLKPSIGEKILKSLTSKRLIRYIVFGSLCITEAGVLWGRRQAIKPQAKIFISYRRDDSRDITERIYDTLASSFGHERLFKDLDYKIPPGVDFPQYLHDVVKTSRLMLVIIGSNWFVHKVPGNLPRLFEPDDFVRLELEHAFKHDLRIIPILVAGASMPSSDSLPKSLRPLSTLQAIEVRRDPDFHSDMDRVIASIRNCVP